MFYRDSEGAVLVFDLTKKESFDLVEKWFEELQGYSINTKMVLVGNKCDLTNKIQVNIEEAKALANKYNATFLCSSALEDKNVSEIFSTLAIEIYHHKMKKEKENNLKRTRKSIKLSDEEIIKKNQCC